MKEQKTKFWIGDNVIVGGNISAKITAVLVNGAGVEYRCAYFYEGGYYSHWLDDYEIQAENATEGKIGFNNFKEGATGGY